LPTHDNDGQRQRPNHRPHGPPRDRLHVGPPLWARLHVEPARLHVGAPAFFLLGFWGFLTQSFFRTQLYFYLYFMYFLVAKRATYIYFCVII
ncbi:hypothetical protein B0H13DRAFT_2017249, partial [Mycena leptocephala]